MMEMVDDVSLPTECNTMVVKVTKVERNGEIKFAHPTVIPEHDTLPSNVKLPIPNDEAYKLVNSRLCNKTFTWTRKRVEPVECNIFSCGPSQENITYTLYLKIVCMLLNPANNIGLPKQYEKGMCLISPICDPKKPYVQPEPAYVDTVSYLIYMSLEERKLRGGIAPAAGLDIGKIYIFSDEKRYYRVRLLEANLMPEPTRYKDSSRSLVGRERETTVSTSWSSVGEYENRRVGVRTVCGVEIDDFITVDNGESNDTSSGSDEKSEEEYVWVENDQSDKENGEKVKVFRIDYGGSSMVVLQSHLYNVYDVRPILKGIPELAFPVTVRKINGSDKDMVARLEKLRDRKEIVEIETKVDAYKGTPAKVDISCVNDEF